MLDPLERANHVVVVVAVAVVVVIVVVVVDVTTDGHSARPSLYRTPFRGTKPDFNFFCRTVTWFSMCGTLSDDRTGL
jgi:hypothetical protein